MYLKLKKVAIIIKILIVCCVVGSMGPLVFFIMIPILYRFLSENHPVDSEVLVVQGWVVRRGYKKVINEFTNKMYSKMIITGNNHTAENAKKKLIKRGIHMNQIASASIHNPLNRHNTFYEAYALKYFLEKYAPEVDAVNVYTASVHGRKTFEIFKKVLGNSISIGVITTKSKKDRTLKWLHSIRGIKIIVRYFIGYVYSIIWNVHVDKSMMLWENGVGYMRVNKKNKFIKE